MEREIRTVAREELYEQVWTTPMRVLAPQYKLSDVGLAKICKRYQIPRPSMGHWAKIRHGKRVGRTPLQPSDDPDLQVIRFDLTPDRRPNDQELDPDVQALVDAESLDTNRIRVSETLRSPHVLVKRTSQALARVKADEYGLLSPTHRDAKACLNVAVSKTVMPRALRILDALVKALECRGHEVAVHVDRWKRSSDITVLGKSFHFRLREKAKRHDHALTKEEKERLERYQYASVPKWDYAPSGRLELQVSRFEGWSIPKVWRDTERKPLEHRLNGVVVDLLKEVGLARIEQRKHRRLAQERHEQECRRLAEEKQRQEEERRVSELLNEMETWHRSNRIRSYLAAVQGTAERRYDRIEAGSELDQWLRWASGVADRLDPLCSTT